MQRGLGSSVGCDRCALFIFIGLPTSRAGSKRWGVEMPFELFKDVPYVGAKAVLLSRLSFHPKTLAHIHRK